MLTNTLEKWALLELFLFPCLTEYLLPKCLFFGVGLNIEVLEALNVLSRKRQTGYTCVEVKWTRMKGVPNGHLKVITKGKIIHTFINIMCSRKTHKKLNENTCFNGC